MRLGDRCHCGGVIRCEQTKPMGASRVRYLICRSCGVRGRQQVLLDSRNRVIGIADNTQLNCKFTIQCNDEHELTQVQQFLKEFRKNESTRI